MNLAIVVLIGVLAVLLLWLIPKLQLRSTRRVFHGPGLATSDYLKAENDRRVTLAQIFGGLAVLAGLVFSAKTIRLTESGQLTDRINKAVEELGKNEIPVNLGGIHQLGRIADDYDEERYAMLQILASFVQTKSALPTKLKSTDCDPFALRVIDTPPEATSQAVLVVIAAQAPKLESPDSHLEINHANLKFLDFSQAHLGRIQLAGDDLSGAQMDGVTLAPNSLLAFSLFNYADLEGGTLAGAKLHNACMAHAHLRNTIFDDADLRDVDFRNVNGLDGASLKRTNIDRADMRGVDLSQVKGLDTDQLKNIICDEFTEFPPDLATSPKALKCAASNAP